jgi:hypothetical protein
MISRVGQVLQKLHAAVRDARANAPWKVRYSGSEANGMVQYGTIGKGFHESMMYQFNCSTDAPPFVTKKLRFSSIFVD